MFYYMCYCSDAVVAMLMCQNNVVILGFISKFDTSGCLVERWKAYLMNGKFSSASIEMIFLDSMKKILLIYNAQFSPSAIAWH